MDLVVAGTEAAVLMVESEAQQLSEEIMLGGVVFGHEQGNIAINAIHELVRDAGKPVWDWQAAGRRTRPSSPRSTAWPRRSCARPTRSAASRPARRRCAKPTPASMAALKAKAASFDAGQGQRPAVRDRSEDRAQPDPGRRAAHRRPRHPHRAPDRDPQRRAAAHPRLGAVHARRDAGAGRRHARHRARRAAHRRAGRRVRRPLHVPLQHASVRHRRNRPHGLAPSAAKSATAASPSARWSPCCRPRKSSRTRCASSRRSPSRTARRRWLRSAAAACR